MCYVFLSRFNIHCYLLPPSGLCNIPEQAVHCVNHELHPYLPLRWLQSKESAICVVYVGCNLLRIMTLNLMFFKFCRAHSVCMEVNLVHLFLPPGRPHWDLNTYVSLSRKPHLLSQFVSLVICFMLPLPRDSYAEMLTDIMGVVFLVKRVTMRCV